jgi:hypothetical protein
MREMIYVPDSAGELLIIAVVTKNGLSANVDVAPFDHEIRRLVLLGPAAKPRPGRASRRRL